MVAKNCMNINVHNDLHFKSIHLYIFLYVLLIYIQENIYRKIYTGKYIQENI